MLEIINNYGIYIAIVVIGVLCIGISGLMNYLEGRRLREIITATVVECKQIEKAIDGVYLKSYEITLELYMGGNTINKTITRGKEMQQWERTNVIYDRSKDEIRLLEVEKKNTSEVPKVMAILGMVMLVIDLIAFFISAPSIDERTKAHLGAIAGVSIFTFIGLYMCIIMPYKRNKRSYNCDLVIGVLVDYYVTGRGKARLFGGRSSSCMPIYEYYYNGETKKLRGSIGGTAGKYKQKGRNVTIAVDRQTNDAYCLEDEKESTTWGVIIVVCTVAFIMLIASWV